MKTAREVIPCAEGIDGKSTVQFSGCNVQIVNGEGSTETTNGTGNLMIGYDNKAYGVTQSGSHNLIIGGRIRS
jgi:hypothetical protein